MTDSATLAARRHQSVQTTVNAVVVAVQGLWRDATPDRILSAMQGTTGHQILNAVLAGQLSVAQGAQAFVADSLVAQGATDSALARLVPGAFAGLAGDGRPLSTLLYLPAYTTARALSLGMPAADAALVGLNQMAMMAATAIADTSRAATFASMAAQPKVVSYVRVVKLPACGRCIILSGRQYSYSTGFQRHPKCDCGMEPLSQEDWRATATAKELFDRMSPAQQEKAVGVAGADAIRNGADLGQVINARRGMAVAASGKKVTTEGVSRRGIGGKALNSGFVKAAGSRYERAREARLMPEQILAQAHGDRSLQLALLKKHGYLT